MNKAEFVAEVATRLNEQKARAGEVVDAVFDTLVDALKKGDEVRLPAFGVFKVRETAARMGRNPQTKEEVPIPAARKARFSPAKALKEALDHGKR